MTSSTGIQTVKEIPAAIETPTASARGFLGYTLIGALVGILPVALGCCGSRRSGRQAPPGSRPSWR